MPYILLTKIKLYFILAEIREICQVFFNKEIESSSTEYQEITSISTLEKLQCCCKSKVDLFLTLISILILKS